MKVGSKKKRSKKELDSVRDVETELKKDKHAFLTEDQNLKAKINS